MSIALSEHFRSVVDAVPPRAAVWRHLLAALRTHRWLFAIVGPYCVFGITATAFCGYPAFRSPFLYMRLVEVNLLFTSSVSVGIGLPFLAIHLLRLMVARRSPQPLRDAFAELRGLATLQRLTLAVPVVLVFLPFASTFTALKAALVWLHPFSWDLAISNLGRGLFGGVDHWQLMQPLFGHPAVTRLLDLVYASWFVVLYATLLWQTLSTREPRLRMRFLCTFVLCWIVLGSLCGTLLSSAGPCDFAQVTGLPDRYAGLMAYLDAVSREHPLIALRAQDYLWQGYQNRSVDLFDGISAMPSMHVAMATLFALLGWRRSRMLGILLSIFAVVIFIGSVELGWHYGLDGYAAALGTILIWSIVGRVQLFAEGRFARTPVFAAGIEGPSR